MQQGKLNVNLKFNALFALLIPSLRMKRKKKLGYVYNQRVVTQKQKQIMYIQ